MSVCVCGLCTCTPRSAWPTMGRALALMARPRSRLNRAHFADSKAAPACVYYAERKRRRSDRSERDLDRRNDRRRVLFDRVPRGKLATFAFIAAYAVHACAPRRLATKIGKSYLHNVHTDVYAHVRGISARDIANRYVRCLARELKSLREANIRIRIRSGFKNAKHFLPGSAVASPYAASTLLDMKESGKEERLIPEWVLKRFISLEKHGCARTVKH